MRRRKGVVYPEKTHITITVDKEVLAKCSGIKNLSAYLNMCLKNYVKSRTQYKPDSCISEHIMSDEELNKVLDELGD